MMAEYIPLRCAIIVLQLWHKGGAIMPLIMPIRDLRKTSEISELAHTKQEPIFITKNGYSDLVVMSAELYEHFARIHKIDQAICEAEEEVAAGADTMDMDVAMERLDKKYYGQIPYKVVSESIS